jgi:hypothetical protein
MIRAQDATARTDGLESPPVAANAPPASELFEPLGPLDAGAQADVEEMAFKQRMRFAVPVRQPLVLISQIQRSGGTLLSQLLDGHSQLHVHPSELHIGRPSKYYWPDLDLSRNSQLLFQQLMERPMLDFALRGYKKLGGITSDLDPGKRDLALPFIFSAKLQEKLFEALLATPPASQRAALDAYVTSYFNAWLDYAGLYRRPEEVKYWVAFAARMVANSGAIESMFADYPDGRLIIPFREPQSWLASAQRHSPEYADVGHAMKLWNAAHRSSLRLFKARPKQVRLVPFEELVGDTESCMRRLSAFLRIDFEPGLLTPSFNRMPILSNSSFEAVHGVDARSLDRAEELDADTRALVRARTDEVYQRLSAIAERQRASAERREDPGGSD